MAASLFFTVPGIPVPCARARTVTVKRRRGDPRPSSRRTFTPLRTEQYEYRVGLAAQAAAARMRWKPSPAALFMLRVDVFRTVRLGDWDNFGKAVADAITKAALWPDDRYVVDGRVRLHVDRKRPRAEVLVLELAENECVDCADWAPLGKPCPYHDDGRGLEVVQ